MQSDCIDHGYRANKPGGYHQRRVKGKLRYVHRLAYAEHHGIDIDDVPPLLRHKCDNPRCVNPHHLLPGSHQDNANDRVSRGRSAKQLPGQWVLTPEQQAAIAQRFNNRKTRYCKVDGVTALAKEYNVSTQAIYGAAARATHTHL